MRSLMQMLILIVIFRVFGFAIASKLIFGFSISIPMLNALVHSFVSTLTCCPYDIGRLTCCLVYFIKVAFKIHITFFTIVILFYINYYLLSCSYHHSRVWITTFIHPSVVKPFPFSYVWINFHYFWNFQYGFSLPLLIFLNLFMGAYVWFWAWSATVTVSVFIIIIIVYLYC